MKRLVIVFALAALCSVADGEEKWSVKEENVSTTYSRYINEESEEHRRAQLLDLTEEQVRSIVPKYAHVVNSISPVPGSRSRSWTYDPLKDPDHIYEGSYYVAAKRNIDRIEDMPAKGRRQLVIATVKGNTKEFFVRFFDNDADQYKDYTLNQDDFRDELKMLDGYRWLERRMNHKWARFQVIRLEEKIAAKTGHTLGEPMRFPQDDPNDPYYENQKMRVKVHFGETIEIPYFQRGDGQKFFLSCALDYARWKWVIHQFRFRGIKSRWLREKDPERKKAHERIITAYAEEYAGRVSGLALCDSDTGVDGIAPIDFGDNNENALRDTRYELPDWVLDYMVVLLEKNAREWFNAKREGEVGLTNGQYLALNVIYPAFEFWKTKSSPHKTENGNVDIMGVGTLIAVGCRYGLKDIAEWTYNYLIRTRRMYNVTADGLGMEGWGYFDLWKGSRVLPALRALRHAELGDEEFERKIETLLDDVHYLSHGKSLHGYAFPSGEPMGNGSCHVRSDDRPPFVRPYDRSFHSAMPSSMVFRMGDGEGEKQVQVAMMNSLGCNHSHEFPLNLLLYANGCPIYSDNSQYGGYLTSHNTVSFDRRSLTPGRDIQEFGFFASRMPGVAAVRLGRFFEDDPSRLKPHQLNDKGIEPPPLPIEVKKFERTLIANTVDLDHPYVVDVFECEGGRFHEYHLHGMNERDMQPGRDGVSPGLSEELDTRSVKSHRNRWDRKISGYWKKTPTYKNCVSTMLKKDGWVDFRFRDKPSEGVRIHLQADPDMKLWVADRPVSTPRTPRMRNAKFPQLVLEHGDEKLGKDSPLCRTVFVVVHEPLNGDSVIESFSHEEINDGKALAIKVSMKDGRKDRYLVSLEETQSMSHEDMQATAELAAAVTKNGKSDLWLVSGESVSVPGKNLAPLEPDVKTAGISEITAREELGQENSILTDAELPVGDALAGQFIIVRFSDPLRDLTSMAPEGEEQYYWYRKDWALEHVDAFHRAYEIDHIRQEGDKRRVILRDYTNVAYDKEGKFWEMQFVPQYAFRKVELVFKNQASTAPVLSYSPRKIYDPANENNFLSVPENRLEVSVTTRPAGAKVVMDPSGEEVQDGKLVLTSSGSVRLRALNPEGVMQPRSIASDYLIGNLPAAEIDRNALELGVVLITEEDDPKKSVLEQVDFSTYAQKTGHKRMKPAWIDGYIDVPVSGMIEFGFFTDSTASDAALYVDGKKVIDTLHIRGLGRLRAGIALEKGLHELRIKVYTNEARLYWKLPGGKDMVIVPKSAFYHSADS